MLLTQQLARTSGVYQNGVIDKVEDELLAKFKAEGVTIVDPSPELKKSLVDTAQKFYTLPEFSNWTPDLYNTVKKNMQ